MSAVHHSSPLADLVFGTDKRMRMRTRMCLLASIVYWVWAVASWFSIEHGMFVNVRGGQLIMALQVLEPFVIFPLVRSGISMRWADPGLVLVQTLSSFVLITFAYGINPDLRGALLQLMCMTQIFSMLRLKLHDIKIVCYGAIASLCGMWALCTALSVPEFDPAKEAVNVLMACFIVLLLSRTSHIFALVGMGMQREKKELATAVQEINRIIMHDTLTGLFNRRRMQELLEAEYARAHRTGHYCCIVLIDLDHFKRINDSHGHNVGDEVLVSFARVVQTVLRETDMVGRWGGEEFLVLMPATHPVQHAQMALNRLREVLQQETVSNAVPELRVTFSAGVISRHDGEGLDHALERADQALYRAKAEGRDRHVLGEDMVASALPI